MVRERTDGGTFGGRRKRKEEAPVGKRVENLKENRKKGISMAIVLCVSAFFLAFAAAIVYTAGFLPLKPMSGWNRNDVISWRKVMQKFWIRS